MPAGARARKWTLEEFYAARDAAPGSERWEFVDGEVLVTPGPNTRHQLLIGRLHLHLAPYVRSHRLGEVLLSPYDVNLEPRRVVVQPDLLVGRRGKGAPDAATAAAVLLAVEVISPSSARFDRVVKRPRYQQNEVPDYWIVDEASETVECWRPRDERPQIVDDELVWHPDGASEAFRLGLPAFFAEVDAAYRDFAGEHGAS
jgi:Uma2 family endonuclease